MPDRFSGTSPSPVDAGDQLTIKFSNPDLADTTVTVTATNGQGATVNIKIKLDGNGNGSVKWPVPATGWGLVRLSHDTSEDHTVPVDTSGGGSDTEAAPSSENRAANIAGDAFLKAQSGIESLLKMKGRSDRAGQAAVVYLRRLASTLRS
jgi:hypothetical protein